MKKAIFVLTTFLTLGLRLEAQTITFRNNDPHVGDPSHGATVWMENGSSTICFITCSVDAGQTGTFVGTCAGGIPPYTNLCWCCYAGCNIGGAFSFVNVSGANIFISIDSCGSTNGLKMADVDDGSDMGRRAGSITPPGNDSPLVITDPDNPDPNPDPGFPPPDPCGGDSASGMPVWQVSEPNISLWLKDEPLGYQPALGPRISCTLAFKQRESSAGFNTNIFAVGKKWNFSWFSYIAQDPNTNNIVFFADGGQQTYTGTNIDYVTGTRLAGNTTNGFTLFYADGSQDVYGLIVTNNSGAFLEAFLTQRLNPQGKKTTLNYNSYSPSSPVIRLQNVVDGDGRTNTISYTSNSYSTNLISQITDPFGRSTSLAYDSNGHLTNITDVAGLSTSMAYDTNDWVTNMVTPYGTNSFKIADTVAGSFPPNGRSVLVTGPDGSKQLFLYTNSAPGIASSYSTNQIPVTSPFANTFDTNSLDQRNTFHWGPRQYAALSTTNISSFTTNDFRKARMKHWLQYVNPISQTLVGQTVSLQRAPSPDTNGSIEGQKTWFDYAGKTNTQYQGTQASPLFIARVLPDGTTSFQRNDRNLLGNVLTNIMTYSSNSVVAFRTNTFAYDTTVGIDLITATNALGVQVLSNSYTTNHLVLTNYDALNQMTVFTYNTNQQLSSITYPSGLILTNIFESDGWVATNYSYASGPIYFGTNVFTYTNDLVFSHTDARGLTTTNLYDNLQRLLKATFPDGTYITNTYNKLDLVQTVDRMGFTNSFGYDAMRRMTAQTNALGNHTLYDHCTCGALSSIQDALGNLTQFYYDNQGRLTNTVNPDGYSVTNFYNLVGQLTNSIDSAGVSVTNWFNNQGLNYASSNFLGQAFKLTFDILDRTTNSVDANGVTITNTYDNLNRALTRTYPDGGTERFGYSAFGLIAYTNQLTNVTLYAYDAALRKIAETNANLEVTQYGYSPAGDLLTLRDGNNNTTTWHYDIFGNTSNKVDAASNVVLTYNYDADNRLTNRNSITKGNTIYAYDKGGNLTNMTYNTNHSLTMSYDAMNRLTNLVDGVGTTVYGYGAVGQLLSEDGPWANDTVSYTYNNRMRIGLSLQQPDADAWAQSYAYDGARRLTNTTAPAGGFTYAYDVTRQLRVSKLSLPNGSYITNAYDTVARLTGTTLDDSTNGVLNFHGYGYNVGNQRTNQSFTAGNFVNYTYDNIGQLKTAKGQEATGGTNRLQEQLGYAYDAGHNLNVRTNNALVETFNVNTLNELSTITRNTTNALTVAGTTSAAATSVTVNGTGAALYADNTFASTNGFTLANGNNTFTAIAGDSLGRHDTNSITVNLPATNSYSYDLNGNLLSDGTRAFDYDDENELVRVTVTNAWKSEFTYDGKFRIRIRKEFTWESSAWVQTNEVHYVYDGNGVIQERDINNLPLVTYIRAGGALLARTDNTIQQTAFYHADGNGNITALVNAQQVLVAKYLYDAFGNILSSSGPLADANVYRFFSREYHVNSGLVRFLARFYDPDLQRWLNRDPVSEAGGINLYAYVGNAPVDHTDPWGHGEGNPIIGPGGTYANTAFGAEGLTYQAGPLFTPSLLGPCPTERQILYGQGLNNTLSGIGQAWGQFLYDVTHFTWSSDEYARIGDLMWNVQTTPENPDATPAMQFAFNVSTMAATAPLLDLAAARVVSLFPAGADTITGLRTVDQAGISASDALRIQNAADRTGQQITVIGSRAGGTADAMSDWDYIFSGPSAARHSAASSVPIGNAGGAIRASGAESGIDIFQSYNPAAPGYQVLDPNLPHVIFTPKL